MTPITERIWSGQRRFRSIRPRYRCHEKGSTPFRGRAFTLWEVRRIYFFVLADPVVWLPGAYSEAPGPVDFLAFCILCPGAYSEAPGPVDFFAFCICCPGGAVDVVGVCPNADAANSIEAATIRDFLNMRSSSMGRHINVSRSRMFQICRLLHEENNHMNNCSELTTPPQGGGLATYGLPLHESGHLPKAALIRSTPVRA